MCSRGVLKFQGPEGDRQTTEVLRSQAYLESFRHHAYLGAVLWALVLWDGEFELHSFVWEFCSHHSLWPCSNPHLPSSPLFAFWFHDSFSTLSPVTSHAPSPSLWRLNFQLSLLAFYIVDNSYCSIISGSQIIFFFPVWVATAAALLLLLLLLAYFISTYKKKFSVLFCFFIVFLDSFIHNHHSLYYTPLEVNNWMLVWKKI